MPTTANPYMYNPEMQNIAGNLATAIFGDPESRMKRDYYQSEVQRNQAAARKTGLEGDRLQTGLNEFEQLPDIYRQLEALPGETPIQTAMRTAPIRGRLAQAYPGSNIKEAADANTTGLANIFAVGDNNDMRRSLVIQGKMPDEDFSGTDARANAVLDNKGGWKNKTETNVANIKAGADMGVARVNQGGQNTRFFNTPMNAKPGEEISFAPTDPRYKSIGPKIKGAPSKVTVEGAAGTRMLNGEQSSTLETLFTGHPPTAANGKPKSVTPKNLNGAIVLGVKSLKGVMDPQNPAASLENFGQFEATFPPDRIAAAHQAASDELARSGNAQNAGIAYLTSLGLKPGDQFQQPGPISSLFGGTPSVVTAAPAQPQAGPAPAAPPVVSAPHQLPLAAQRPDGMQIDSPKGRMRWDARTQSWLPVVGGGA